MGRRWRFARKLAGTAHRRARALRPTQIGKETEMQGRVALVYTGYKSFSARFAFSTSDGRRTIRTFSISRPPARYAYSIFTSISARRSAIFASTPGWLALSI